MSHGGGLPVDADRVASVAQRELRTVVRTRAYAAAALGFGAVVVGLAWVGRATGYVAVTLTLLPAVELLVPAVAAAFGYRAVLVDAERGELDAVRTYPVVRAEYVGGVYLGRAAALLPVVVAPLVLAGLLVPLVGGPGSSVIATHPGVDSPVLYLRFVALTAAFAAVVLAAVVGVSTAATGTRAAVAFAVVLVVALVVGFDLGIVAALAGDVVGEGSLQWVLALSPNSAYRGLVLQTVVGGTAVEPVRAAAPAASAAGLAAWLVAALAYGTVRVWPE